MDRLKKKIARRTRIKRGIRKKATGTPERPRLSVFRSNKEIYAQIIDDINGKTLISASSLSDVEKSGKKIEVASRVGKELAKKAQEANIKNVIFDRNGYLYHGRVKALGEGAREGGLEF